MRVRPLVEFAVEGFGDFPLDMLRYDECWPANSTAATTMAASARRVVSLRTINHMPTIGRWESFGWRVLHVDQMFIRKSAEEIAADERAVDQAEARSS